MAAKNVVIVESPAKAKTIEKYLGSDYSVVSSYGHIRDLPKKGMSVDIENNFEPTYDVPASKKKTVSALKKAVKEAETVWLASDEDREGEAIAWHLYEALKLKPDSTKRITFNEITKPAVEKAIKNPREIDQGLVDAQQARRILDRVVGYELSPLLWRKVQPGLSAGRVQSVAVRLIVEREREIENFEPKVSFKVQGVFAADGTTFEAKLDTDFPDIAAAKTFLEASADADYSITAIEKRPGTRRPGAPFTTSTLQQTAARKLGMSPKQTMMLAQRLYEAGAITYMRTDSVNLSQQALAQAQTVITKEYGADYHKRRAFSSKAKGAQEAHEAIRPTQLSKAVAGTDDRQKKLYQLIRNRTLASQMADAKVENTTATIGIRSRDESYKAKGEIVTFEGFMKAVGRPEDVVLPNIAEGDSIKAERITATETLSRGPARYTEATLVRTLEELGIGRPSTYAPTISTIQDRGYVEKVDVEGTERTIHSLVLENSQVTEKKENKFIGQDKNKLTPTSVGVIVTDFLYKHFENVLEYNFTAELEGDFDRIAAGEKQWRQLLKEFYPPFHEDVEKAQNVSKKEAAQAREVGKDPKTNKTIYARLGRYGPMLQMGEAEDEEKPRFAPLPKGHTLENVTLDAALKAFELPRTVGTTEDGEEIIANVGRFGPYIKVNKTFVSLGKDGDPHTIDEATARSLYKEHLEKKKKQQIKSFEGIEVKDGRYGPYVTNGKKNAKVPKDVDPHKITKTQAEELLAKKKPARKRKKK